MSFQFNTFRDGSGSAAYAPLLTHVNKTQTTLLAGIEQTFTMPTDAKNYVVLFGYNQGATVFIGWGSSAISTPGASFSSTTADINPQARTVPGGTILRFKTIDVQAFLTVDWYAAF